MQRYAEIICDLNHVATLVVVVPDWGKLRGLAYTEKKMNKKGNSRNVDRCPSHKFDYQRRAPYEIQTGTQE